MRILGLETAKEGVRLGSTPIPADPAPGDGKATAWVLEFFRTSGGGQFAVLVRGGSLEVVSPVSSPPPAEPLPRVLDSPEALRHARTDPAFAAAAAKAHTIGLDLVRDPPRAAGPAWVVTATGEGSGHAVTLNAETGAIRLSEPR